MCIGLLDDVQAGLRVSVTPGFHHETFPSHESETHSVDTKPRSKISRKRGTGEPRSH